MTTSKRDGAIPYGGSFGHSSAIELPLPIDSFTTNVGTGLEWANRTALVRVNWDGSFNKNNIQTVVWDNPVRLTDFATAPGQGRMPLWPTNRFNTVSSAASVRLPVRSRLTGSVALGWMDQNEALVPNTINPALSAAALQRIERGHDMQHRQPGLIPPREGDCIAKKANRRVTEIDRTEIF